MRVRYASVWIALLIVGILATVTITAWEPPVFEQNVTPPVTATPIFPPLVPSPTSLAPGCATHFPIDIGGSITLRPGVNIRTAPSVSSPWLASFDENRIFTVLDGPQCGDNYIWWYITGHGVTGWVAERDSQQTFIRFFDPDPDAPLECRTPLALRLNEQIELTASVRIRHEPGLEGLVITIAPYGSTVTIVNATPRCANGYNWWQVRAVVANFEYIGWMVEGRRSTEEFPTAFVELTPAPDCSIPMRAQIGDRGRVRYFDRLPKNLRAEPGLDGELLYTLVDGVPLEIIGGPVCVAGMNYWHVSILASTPVTGWLAEGPRPNHWIKITNDIGRTFATFTPQPTIPGAVTLTPIPSLTPIFSPTPTPTVTP